MSIPTFHKAVKVKTFLAITTRPYLNNVLESTEIKVNEFIRTGAKTIIDVDMKVEINDHGEVILVFVITFSD